MTDERTQYTAEEAARLINAMGRFLHEQYPADSEEYIGELTGKISHWLLTDKTELVSPDKMLPKAKYRLQFNVVDEPTGEHIIRVCLDRTREMADGDFMQLQNFFWVTIGRAIRDNPEIIRTLEAGGIRIEIDPKPAPAPGGMYA